MKAITYLISLLLGLGGGFAAFYIMERGKQPVVPFPHEIVGPDRMQPEKPRGEAARGTRRMEHVDLRTAAERRCLRWSM